jgi:hypothetical protein
MESEKKLKLMSVLALKSASLGHISISKFSQSCTSSSSHDFEDISVIANQFLGILQDVNSDVSDDDMHVLVFIAGYVGRKLKQSLTCTDCVNELVSPDDLSCDVKTDDLIYVHALDRGGLKWPRQALVDTVVAIFCLFQQLLSSKYEQLFVEVRNQKQLVVYLSVELLQSKLSLNCVCESGHDTMQDLFKPVAGKMANILLNNYCKRINDAAVCSKEQKSKKSRKLATLKK